MNRFSIQFTLLAVCIAFQSSAIASPAADKATKPPVWNQKMKKMYDTLSHLLVDVSSDSRFDAPANRAQIESNAKLLAELAHDIAAITRNGKAKDGSEVLAPDSDPSLPLISSLFDEDAKRAYAALKSGHRGYARSILRTISGYCVGCHTRNNTGPQFASLPQIPAVKSLTRLEKAEFMAATRQNDAALTELETIAADSKSMKDRPLEWEKAVRYALAISVRVKRDPERALKIVDKVLTSKEIPTFMKEDAIAWKKELTEWKEEAGRKFSSDEGLYAEAMRLIAQARATQKFPADRSADVTYLRMSTVVHDLLSHYPDSRYSADALFLLGLSYEALRDLNLWSLHEMYYESCIRKSPHSEIARSCYRHYEQTIYLGYSGSGGVSIPKDVKKKLAELDAMAKASEKLN